MVTTAQQQVTTVQAYADYANQPAVQLAATATANAASALDGTLTKLSQALLTVANLKVLRGQQAVALHRCHGNLETSLNTVCAGKKDLITAWGGVIETRTAATPTTSAPLKAEARNLKKTSGSVVAQCKAEPGAVCYLFQQGSDPAHPETWPPPVIESGCTHKLTGQTVGAKLYFRVAIQRRKTGLGQWSDILEVTVK
jgi:hypothetical protein